MSEIGPQMTPPERHRPGRSQCQTHMLARDGKRLVSFSGVLLAQNLGKPDSWDARDDWAYYDLSLYHAADGDYLVHWAYSTTRKGELFHHAVAKFDTLEGAMNALETFQPTKWVAERSTLDDQVRIRERYHAQVLALCEELAMAEEW